MRGRERVQGDTANPRLNGGAILPLNPHRGWFKGPIHTQITCDERFLMSERTNLGCGIMRS